MEEQNYSILSNMHASVCLCTPLPVGGAILVVFMPCFWLLLCTKSIDLSLFVLNNKMVALFLIVWSHWNKQNTAQKKTGNEDGILVSMVHPTLHPKLQVVKSCKGEGYPCHLGNPVVRFLSYRVFNAGSSPLWQPWATLKNFIWPVYHPETPRSTSWHSICKQITLLTWTRNMQCYCLIGSQAFDIFCSLTSWPKPITSHTMKTSNNWKRTLYTDSIWNSEMVLIQPTQLPHEGTAAYIAEVHHLPKNCNFFTRLESLLRDWLLWVSKWSPTMQTPHRVKLNILHCSKSCISPFKGDPTGKITSVETYKVKSKGYSPKNHHHHTRKINSSSQEAAVDVVGATDVTHAFS